MKVSKFIKRSTSIILIFTIFSYILISSIFSIKTYAVQTRESYSSKINNYPGYAKLIESLKEAHPNWTFTMLYTGLDWNQVLKNETTAYHGRNLIYANKTSSWYCSICGDKKYDNGSWRCASETTVAYYMDPRNSLNENDIFQFETLSYNEQVHTIEGVKKIISDVKYMQTDKITYTKTDGTTDVINKSYAEVIMEAAKSANISPYHLAARIRQEQGTGSSPSALATGNYSGYVGYYNFMNINASGSGNAAIIANGLSHAKEKGWTTPEISITEGAKFLANSYISVGQDTQYLQKFDVDNSDGRLYYHQYMQNVSASKSEAEKARKTYKEIGVIDNNFNFIIPVYENMPNEICEMPKQEGIVTQDVKVKGDKVNVREGKTTEASVITMVNTGDVLLRIETASSQEGGYYWDKVVLPDGKIGYIARNYIVEISDITNCNDTLVSSGYVNLRNGPGYSGTTVVTMLSKAQVVTRIEKGKYNIDNYIWDRVVLEDGRKGYIEQNYLAAPGTVEDETVNDIIKVICKSGLKVRETPSTDGSIITYVDNGDVLTRTKREVAYSNGYIWDKVVTSQGIEGYIARGDSNETYIEVISEGTSETEEVEEGKDYKLEDEKIICTPSITIDSLKNKFTDVVIKNASGTVVDSGNIGTGYSITKEDKTYTVIKLGDISGDGTVDARDSLRILKYSVGTYEIKDEFAKAADLNGDGIIDARDSLRILKYSVGTYNINL